jgi:hypothetical protein
MEPLDDNELNKLLRQWEAPAAPPSLKQRVFPNKTTSLWSWLLNGSVRVPVPVALAAALLIGLWIYHSRPADPPRAAGQPATVSLTDFRPVHQLEPVLVSGGQKK